MAYNTKNRRLKGKREEKRREEARVKMLVRIGIAATILGVCAKTLRRWEKKGKIKPVKTVGNHRRYNKEALMTLKDTQQYEPTEKPPNNIAIYARVSASRQKEDLERQISILREKAKRMGAKRVFEYQDIASGLSDTIKGLKRLLRDASQGLFRAVIVTYGDRLARFGNQIIKEILAINGVQLKIIAQSETKEPQQQIIMDIVALMHSFSGKFYRMRRGKPIRRKSKTHG